MNTIEIQDVGPVHKLSIPIPEKGGIVVLEGDNGVGKSISLESVEALATGRNTGDLAARDGTSAGFITGMGITITVGRSNRRLGELVATSLKGKLSIEDLIDPPYKGDNARDEHRIKSLCQIANIEPKAELFHELFGNAEEFEAIVGDEATAEDIIRLADKVKRAIEAQARKTEGQQAVEESHQRACEEAAAGIDINVTTDVEAIQTGIENAIRDEQRLKSQRDAFLAREKEIAYFRQQLDAATTNYTGPTVEEAAKAVEATSLDVSEKEQAELDAVREVAAAQKALDDAVHRLELRQNERRYAEASLRNSKSVLESAKHHEATVASLKESLAGTDNVTAPPSESEIAEVTERIESLRAASRAADQALTARRKLDKAKEHQSLALSLAQQAKRLRDAAGSVDGVLTSQIEKLGCPLKVIGGRLFVETERGMTPYDELSDGERTRIAVAFAVTCVGSSGLLTMSQKYYEGLPPKRRDAIHNQLQDTGVVLVTAECNDANQISARIYGETPKEPEDAEAPVQEVKPKRVRKSSGQ